ncbi:EF-hand domain-containing protein [Lysobacter gummosus]|uniref:calcium-dependent protein kinase 21 n=2 Tax=Lysobacter gummosus TaxID=262324 RepID=UPI003624D6D6
MIVGAARPDRRAASPAKSWRRSRSSPPSIRARLLSARRRRVRLSASSAAAVNMRHRPLAFVLYLSLSCPALCAAQAVTSTGDYLARIDGDGDGRISLSEYQDWLSYAFDAMDANRDGVLDAQEQPASGRGARATLTREQHRQTLAERFRKQDRNHDGWLDARELASPPQ